MIEMAMGENHRIDRCGIEGKIGRPAAPLALLRAAVDEDAAVFMLDKRAGAGDGAGSAEECEAHWGSFSREEVERKISNRSMSNLQGSSKATTIVTACGSSLLYYLRLGY
jgi:hypothetical protein